MMSGNAVIEEAWAGRHGLRHQHQADDDRTVRGEHGWSRTFHVHQIMATSAIIDSAVSASVGDDSGWTKKSAVFDTAVAP